MNLLSSNDFKTLREAMLRGEEICLIRILGNITVNAATYRVQRPPWDVDIILQIRLEKGNITYIQNFKSVEEARLQVNSWLERTY